jgi:hypothetical protein
MTTPIHHRFLVAQPFLFTLTQEGFTPLAPSDFPEGTQEWPVRFAAPFVICSGARRGGLRRARLGGRFPTRLERRPLHKLSAASC